VRARLLFIDEHADEEGQEGGNGEQGQSCEDNDAQGNAEVPSEHEEHIEDVAGYNYEVVPVELLLRRVLPVEVGEPADPAPFILAHATVHVGTSPVLLERCAAPRANVHLEVGVPSPALHCLCLHLLTAEALVRLGPALYTNYIFACRTRHEALGNLTLRLLVEDVAAIWHGAEE